MSSNNAQAQAREHDRAVRRAERERARRVARDEAAERKRAAKSGFANVSNPRRSRLLTLVCAVFAVYCLFPFVYLLINATKTQADFTSTFGLGFGKTFALFDNIATVFTYQDGIFGRWFVNTILYVVVGAGGATLLAIMGGYALAKKAVEEHTLAEAVLLGSDEVAEGALEAFRELGVRVPKDVAVIIYQDIQTLESKWPTGTCLEMFPDYVWENALELLFGRISQRRSQAVTVTVPTHLKIGDTA